MDPTNIEETFGSVTQIDVSSPTSGVALRSSARVSKKKLDSLNKSLITSPTSEKRDVKKEEIPEETTEKAPARFWPAQEKELFFEALNEFGKDFNAIQQYFVLKSKKSNATCVKTVKQIRYFYYRTWAKISPKLVFPPHIKKQTKELYGLINYGEMRKKVKIGLKKDALRLNELVIRGFTQLRGKNKNIHIRTPRCRTLRRLCQLEDTPETETRLPSSIRMELLPADNATWARVQAIAQNPRVYIHVPLQYRLSNLFHYLQRRWMPRHEKYKTKVMEVFDADTTPVETNEALILQIKPDAELHTSQINLSNYNSHTKLCLSAYEGKLGKKGEAMNILKQLYAEHGSKVKKQKLESAAEREAKKSECDKERRAESERDALLLREMKKSDEESKEQIVEVTSMDTSVNSDPSENPPDQKKEEAAATVRIEGQSEEVRKENVEPEAEPVESPNEEVMSRLKAGLTVDTCGSMTVGDIYLMMGQDHKVELNYHWRPNEVATEVSALGSLLSRLVRLAQMTRNRCPIKCPCGHQCSDAKRPRKDSQVDDCILTEGGFRRPATQIGSKRPASGAGRLDAESFKAQMDKLTPRYCNRRGRGITPKNVVVQRTLPLLPKANNGHSVVALKLIQQSPHLPGEFLPIQMITAAPSPSEPRRIAPKMPPSQPPEPPPSPTPSISTLLDDTLRDFPPPANFAGGGIDDNPPPSPSPSMILREGWLNEEVTDYSLSSILAHLETPLKPSNSLSTDSAPLDVESHLQYLMAETSIDFTAKFADLAAKVASEGSQ